MGGKNWLGDQVFTLPLKGDLKLPFFLAILITILMTVASVGSLLFPESFYPTVEQRDAFLTNDAVNLLVGFPMMLVTIALVRRGRLVSLVIWPGALMYVIYNYLAYIFGMPLSWVTGLNAALVILSLASGMLLILNLDLAVLADMLTETGPRLVAAAVILIFGAGFFIQAAQKVAGFVSGSGIIARTELGVFAADLVVSVIWFAGGVLLMLRKPLGYPLGWGGMFGVVMLNVGLLAFLILQPALTDLPFELVDLIIIVVFTFLCAVPFGLFIRGLRP